MMGEGQGQPLWHCLLSGEIDKGIDLLCVLTGIPNLFGWVNISQRWEDSTAFDAHGQLVGTSFHISQSYQELGN